jgi:hypothetical protein
MSASRFLASLALAALALAAGPGAEAGGKRPVVVELYTSQGCSSCPPADALLGRLADRKDVLAMSLPVTYWDMLGWKDTLASDANTKRQKAYAAAMGRGGVYTPQMIVDGASDVVGSREAAVEAAIAARQADMTAVPVTLQATNTEIHLAVGTGDPNANATIWLFRILGKASVAVGAGENDGRTLVYRNIVRDVKAIGIWKGQALSLDLPRVDPMTGAADDAVAAVLQQGGSGRIIGAAVIGRPGYAP